MYLSLLSPVLRRKLEILLPVVRCGAIASIYVSSHTFIRSSSRTRKSNLIVEAFSLSIKLSVILVVALLRGVLWFRNILAKLDVAKQSGVFVLLRREKKLVGR
jgi:hypothetical protein